MPDAWFQALMLNPIQESGIRCCSPLSMRRGAYSSTSVLGSRLRPFSLIHHYTLQSLGNTYIVGGDKTEVDLLQAVFVCSRTWAELQYDLFERPSSRSMGRLGRKLRKDNGQAAQAFVEYLEDGSKMAPHFSSDNGVDIGAPWQFHVVKNLVCSRLAKDACEAWNMGFGLAICYSDTWLEGRGSKALMSEYDQKFNKLMEDAAACRAEGAYARADELYDEAQALADEHFGNEGD